MEKYFNKIIALFVKSDVSTSSQDDFHRWLIGEKNSNEKEKALHNLWDHMTNNKSEETSFKVQLSLQSVLNKIKQRKHKGNVKSLLIWQISAAVLFIALLSSLYFMFNKTQNNPDLIEQYVPIAKMTQLTLPDGTRVQMNSTSTLLYPEQFTGETRSVYLLGEANFKVAENKKKPFIVKANDYLVTALGTEFIMKVYPDDPTLSTMLISGSVEVKFNNLSSVKVLKPSEQFTYNKHTKEGTISYPDLEDVTAWQRGELIFKSATLEEIITVLERKYPNSFVYTQNTLKEDKYTFRFKDQTPLQEIMDIIVEVSGNIKYRTLNGKYYISQR